MIICVVQVLKQPVSAILRVPFFKDKTRFRIYLGVWSIVSNWPLHNFRDTSFCLFGSGAEQLIANGITDVFFTIFERWSCMKAGEGLDSVVEVSVAQIMGNSHV